MKASISSPARPHLILVVDTTTGKFLTTREDENGKGEDVNIVRGPEPPRTNTLLITSRRLENPKVLNETGGEEEGSDKKKKIEKPTKIVFACTKNSHEYGYKRRRFVFVRQRNARFVEEVRYSNRVRICAERDHTKHHSRAD